jgi:hypothetical protein
VDNHFSPLEKVKMLPVLRKLWRKLLILLNNLIKSEKLVFSLFLFLFV